MHCTLWYSLGALCTTLWYSLGALCKKKANPTIKVVWNCVMRLVVQPQYSECDEDIIP